MIAQSIDLLRLHDITTAIIVPNPTPGPTYTGCVYTGPEVLVHDAKIDAQRIISVRSDNKFLFMKVF